MGWWIAGGIGVVWMLYVAWASWDSQGKHNLNRHDTDILPTGLVWWRKGEGWYTQPRRDWAVPRNFSSRSNPLDHEYEWEKVRVPPEYRDVPREVEY